MQSLLLPAPWFSNTHFGQSKLDIDPGPVSIHLRPSTTGLRSGLRISHPSLLMSSFPSTKNTIESAQNPQRPASRGLDVTTTSAAVDRTVTPAVPVSDPSEGPIVRTTQAQRFLPTPAVIYEHRTPTISSSFVGGIPLALSESTHHPPTTSSTTVRTLPPRSTRRTKAHVASACVNCKRKHLGCDSARPCRRCELAGKSATCVDVTHKKRGRPPLKAEEAPIRPYTSAEGSMPSREVLQTTPSNRGHAHSRTSSREIRPMTDLQFPRTREYGIGAGSGVMDPMMVHAQRWTFPSPQMSAPPSSRISRPREQRPFSSPVSLPPSGRTYPPTPMIPSPSAVYSPSTGGYEFRPTLSYNNPSHAVTPPTISPQQYQQPFPLSRMPHVESPQTPTRPAERAGSSREIPDPYHESGLRLPPILPSTRALRQSPSSHRRSGSYSYPSIYPGPRSQIAELQPQTQSLGSPHPLLEPLPSQFGLQPSFPAVPRSLGPIIDPDRPSLVGQAQQQPEPSAVRAQGEPNTRPERRRRDESDDTPQPKRRRMALDDIVND